MHIPRYLTLCLAACLSAALSLSSCKSSDARARDALNAYQVAEASNDLVGAKKALLELVRAKDDVPDYWVELGKLQASMGNYSDAYYAFSRAYELDRTNVDVLRSVTPLALRAGDLPSAQRHAEELSILAPGDPWPKLVAGWAAISESHFDQAIAAADGLLANAPYDPSATMLKARALLGLNRQNDAVDLLNKQVQAQPSDSGNLQLLRRIYQRQGDWTKVFNTAQQLSNLTPADQANGLLLIEAGFRSGKVAAAREASIRLLRPAADPNLIRSVMEEWLNYWPSAQRIIDARALASGASGLDRKLVYAAFLNEWGRAEDTLHLIGNAAGSPVDAKNAEANAVLADAEGRMGNISTAKSRFDAVLAFDPGNGSALRGRAELELRTGHADAAIVDAEKLVAALPMSVPDRILLARSYVAAGKNTWADRTLWQAFQDIPANESIYAALQATRSGNPVATQELQGEFDRQRDEQLGRGMV